MRLKRFPKAAFCNDRQIQAIQQEGLRQHLLYCEKNSPYYRRLFKAARLDLRKINLQTLSTLPFTDKSQLEEGNDDFLAVNPQSIADIVLSSGTTGRPTRIMYTAYDLERLAYNEEKSFLGCDMGPKDRVLLTCTMDRCFVAGLAYFLGARAVGAAVIRNGLNTVESHGDIIKRLKPTAIVGVPSFIRKLGFYLREKNIPTTSVNKIIGIGEPLRDESMNLLKMGRDLAGLWNAKFYSTYSSSEIVTTFCECTQRRGGHLHPDLAVVEIVDDAGSVVAPGEKGEVVVTPLGIEGMPLVRFKTGDISFVIEGRCGCGRNSLRLGPILGRKKQMMKVKGTTIYPQAVFNAIEEIEGVTEYYLEVSPHDALSDEIMVHLSVNIPLTVEKIKESLQAKLRVMPAVVIEDEKIIREKVFASQARKPIRLWDKR